MLNCNPCKTHKLYFIYFLIMLPFSFNTKKAGKRKRKLKAFFFIIVIGFLGNLYRILNSITVRIIYVDNELEVA